MKNKTPDEQLSELLQLKKHEKPQPDFWLRFDSELKDKAFSHLIQQKHSKPLLWAKKAWQGFRPIMPATATAAFLFAFIANFQPIAHSPLVAKATVETTDTAEMHLDAGKVSSVALSGTKLLACQSVSSNLTGIRYTSGSVVSPIKSAFQQTHFSY